MPDGLDRLKGRERLNLLKFVCSFAWADLEIRSEERRFIKRLGGPPEVIEIDSGHDPMITRPNELAKILLRHT